MTTQKKSTTLLITAASVVLTSCVSAPISDPVQTTNPVVVNATPTPEELYAQRFRASVVQVDSGGKSRFVVCDDDCQGATPKTPRGSVNAQLTKHLRKISQERLLLRKTPAISAPQPTIAAVKTAPAMKSIVVTPERSIVAADNSIEPAIAKVTPIGAPVIEKRDVVVEPVVVAKTDSRAEIETVSGTRSIGKTLEYEEFTPSTSNSAVVHDHANVYSDTDALTDAQIEALVFIGEPMDVIHFRQGSAILDPASLETVSSIANAWQTSRDFALPLLIAGFTNASTEHSIKFNQVLAQKRAEAVRDALLAHGVPQHALRVVAHSQCCNVADGSTEHGRAKNRRTEIHVLTNSS